MEKNDNKNFGTVLINKKNILQTSRYIDRNNVRYNIPFVQHNVLIKIER